MGVFLMVVSFVVFLWACVSLIHPQTARIPTRSVSVVIWLGSVVLFVVGAGLADDSTRTSSPAPRAVKAAPRASCASYPSDIRDIVVGSITQERLVHDAALSQSACDLSLVLMVNAAITEAAARELGDNFVRQVKSLVPKGAQDESLGVDIGRSQYNYTIGVYASGTKEPIAVGAKIDLAQRITW